VLVVIYVRKNIHERILKIFGVALHRGSRQSIAFIEAGYAFDKNPHSFA